MGGLFGSSPKARDYKPGPHEIMAARRSLADHQRFEKVYGTARKHMWERAKTDRAAIGRGVASADIQQKLGSQGIDLAGLLMPTAGAEDIQKKALAMGDVTSKARGQTLAAKTDVIASAQNQRIVADKGLQQLGRTEMSLGIGEARNKRASKKLVTDSILAGTMQMAGAAKERMSETIWDPKATAPGAEGTEKEGKGAYRKRGAGDFFKSYEPFNPYNTA